MTDPAPVEGIWDDVQEGLKWKPILPLLKKARETQGEAARLLALRDVGAFVLKNLTGRDPYTSPAFATFALIVDLAQNDPRVLASVTRLLPKERPVHANDPCLEAIDPTT